MNMYIVRFLKDTNWAMDGRTAHDYKEGQEADVNERNYKMLVGCGFVELVEGKRKKAVGPTNNKMVNLSTKENKKAKEEKKPSLVDKMFGKGKKKKGK